ncbi:MAG: MarR family winged helix-turn-helix transcriptional regulator [Actinomycetota bacterium]
MGERETTSRDRRIVPGAAFLLSQVGVHSSRLWGERMTALGLDPRHVVLLRLVAAGEGSSQHALGEQMRLPPSRMVSFVDELEDQGLLERRSDPGDRRVRALYLTDQGRKTLDEVMRVSAEHEAQLCAGLEGAEREQLIALLSRIVTEQGLAPGVHPGLGADGMPKP